MITILDDKDTQQIEGVQMYISLQVMIETDSSKDCVQYIRNLIENLYRNKDFINPLLSNTSIVDKYTKQSNSSAYEYLKNKNELRNFISYHKFEESNNYADPTDYVFLKSVMANCYIMINNSLDLKLYEYSNSSLITNFNFFSNKLKTLFVFPYNSISNDINKFENTINIYAELSKNYTEYYYNKSDQYDLFKKIEVKNFTKKLTQSPYSKGVYKNISYIYKNTENANIFYPTVSVKYNENNITNKNDLIDYIGNKNKINDIVNVELNTSLIDDYNFQITSSFRGIKVFSQNINEKNNQSILLTPKSCNYFKKLYNINNNITKNITNKLENIFPDILSCFLYKEGNDLLNDYFFKADYDEFYIKRRLKIPAVNSYLDQSVDKAIYYKVFKNQSPDAYILNLVNSDYFTVKQLNIYVLKNQKFMERVFSQVYINFIGVMFMILFFNCLFWYILLFIIYCLLFKVTTSLTKPINELCKLVKSIGKEETEQDKESWNNVKSDDEDIKELFELCKNLIKGGFSDSNSRMKEKRNENFLLNNAYNNISYVKTNNLIIEEEIIEKSSNFSAETIFNYKKNAIIEHNPTHPKEENINPELSKETGISNREHSNSLLSRIQKKLEKENNLKIGSNTEVEIYQVIEELQKKEEKDFLMFELFKNADLKIFTIDKEL